MRKKKSIIVDDMEHCKLCGSPYVEIHHCLHGTANRKKADINANIRMYRNDHLKMYKITL